MAPILYIVIPCYNEEAVLEVTAPQFLGELTLLIQKEKIHRDSRIMFVNDGSKDSTWQIIQKLSKSDSHFIGISQSRNRGHQNTVLAGMMEAKDYADIVITIDCDGQDDITAMEDMVDAYADGCEIVYGVRDNRESDTFFKRVTAEGFYRILRMMGAEVVFNHADYRLVSKKALDAFADFKEVNLYLRGMFPLVGFKSTSIYYSRNKRVAGESHYPLRKMLSLAFDGVTSLSVKPIRMVMSLGFIIAFLSFVGIVWAIVGNFRGLNVSGWTSTTCIICFVSGMQMFCLGIIGEYIGKIYLETKGRPRYIISDRTYAKGDNNIESQDE